jgi:hypothetical protein
MRMPSSLEKKRRTASRAASSTLSTPSRTRKSHAQPLSRSITCSSDSRPALKLRQPSQSTVFKIA